MKELTSVKMEKFKNNLIKLKNNLVEKFKKKNRRKKTDIDYYEYEENKFYGLKNVRNLFNQNDDNDDIYDIYEDIKCLFSKNEEIKDYAYNIYETIKEKKG